MLPQLATIYYAGKRGLKVLTESEELVGIPITAYIPDIGLAIDVCCSKKIIAIKDYICETKGITYVSIPGKLPEVDTIKIIRKAFSDAHLYFHSDIEVDLDILKNRYSYWKKKDLDA